MGMTIFNLLMNPIIDYYVEIDNRVILRKLIIMQTCISLIYLLDIIFMFLIFGFKEIMLNRTIALRLELVVQFIFFYSLLDGHADVYNTQYD